jgi:CheY-like chemotaxis protein
MIKVFYCHVFAKPYAKLLTIVLFCTNLMVIYKNPTVCRKFLGNFASNLIILHYKIALGVFTMTSPVTVTAEEFEQHVRDCLAHLYDYSYLREHPLVQLLVPDQSGAAQVQSFRQVITEAIENLRPDMGATFHSKQARIYNILMLRYIDQQLPQDVMIQLALSERQFYRDHPKAINTLSHILWEHVTGDAVSHTVHEASAADISLESEVQRVQSEQAQIDITALLEGAINATQSLASQHHVQVTLALKNELPQQGINGSVLRQAVLLIMSQLIVRFDGTGQLTLNGEVAERQCRITFMLNGETDDAPTLSEGLAQNKSLRALIESIDAELNCEQRGDDSVLITLDVAQRQQTVLLVDDNPGMIDLFNRYLGGQPYHILVAPDGEQAIQLARQTRPGLIILDVMLPGKDGWEVLQNLKNHPTTRHIPVLICSVLDATELAMSLGADAYLKKPPSQGDFLDVLTQWQQ